MTDDILAMFGLVRASLLDESMRLTDAAHDREGNLRSRLVKMEIALRAARTAALDEALAAWTEAAHGLEPDEVEEGSYHAGWDDGVEVYRDAIRKLKEQPR